MYLTSVYKQIWIYIDDRSVSLWYTECHCIKNTLTLNVLLSDEGRQEDVQSQSELRGHQKQRLPAGQRVLTLPGQHRILLLRTGLHPHPDPHPHHHLRLQGTQVQVRPHINQPPLTWTRIPLTLISIVRVFVSDTEPVKVLLCPDVCDGWEHQWHRNTLITSILVLCVFIFE